LCRRVWNGKVALLAALFTALDPIQIGASVMARPYALAGLACIGSFYFLLLIVSPRRRRQPALGVVGYALCMASLGYLNPVLLLVAAAHGAIVFWPLFPLRRNMAWWMLAGVLAALLFVPEMQ